MLKAVNERSRGAAWLLSLATLLLAGCYGRRADVARDWLDWHKPSKPRHDEPPPDAPPTEAACDREADREAILGMVGTFDVAFSFEEVEGFEPDYALREPYRTSALEAVIAVEDSEERIVLQHVLLIDLGQGQFYPLKHWRQDWVFQDAHLLEFQGERRWTHRTLSEEEVRCSWSQAVSQVDDGPRYESYGRWVHEEALSIWTSHETWRPLPRRESSRSEEYDVLVAVNTHTVHAEGWIHGEDNLKWVLDSSSALVRELGENTYDQVDAPAATLAAQDYLAWTGEVWTEVRREWDRQLGDTGSVRVHETVDGVASYDVLLPLAETLADAPASEREQAIRDAISRYVTPLAE